MEMKLIEVALALVVIYLVLALAATQLAELWAAGRGHRPKTLKSILDEVFQKRDELVRKFLAYAPIHALSEGNKIPSAIPPALFAAAFLAVLNEEKPPRDKYRSPALFINALEAKGGNDGLVQVLQAHAAGGVNWDTLEAKVAQWYADICDRAEGWYKRTSSRTMLWIAAMLAVAANADTVYIARSLMENDMLRVSVANIGELLADLQADEKLRAAGLQPPAKDKLASAASATTVRPFDISAELDKALGEIRSASNLSPQLFAFGDNQGDIARDCSYAGKNDKAKTLYDSNFDAWPVLLPFIFNQVEQASLGIDHTKEDKLANVRERATQIRKSMLCTTAIAAWLRAAQYSTKNKDAQSHMKEASAALERARERMQALIASSAVQSSLIRSYALLGPAFSDCASEAGDSRAAFDKCLAGANANSIPLGWPSRGGQFCKLSIPRKSTSALPGDSAPVCTTTTLALATCPEGTPPTGNCTRASMQTTCTPPDARAVQKDGAQDSKPHPFMAVLSSLGGCEDFAGAPNLELPAIQARVDPGRLMGGMFGLFITTIMVSLGGPFWYGVLGKVATLRMAGRVRGLDSPPPSPDDKARQATGSGGDDAGGGGAPFDDALNLFERALQPQEISRLQIALNMAPTMVLDKETRDKIAERLGQLGQTPERCLNATRYFLIVGREAAQAADINPPAPIRAMADFSKDQLASLLDALNAVFPRNTADSWKPLSDSDNFDELRARLTLFRFKSDIRSAPRDKAVVSLALNDPAALARVDNSLMQQVLEQAKLGTTYRREKKAWMDIAYGELGVREIPGAADNPRVVEYLLAIGGKSAATDETAWCGAFVGWVLDRAGMLDTLLANATGLKLSRTELRKASNWHYLGTERNGNPEPGDICVVQTGNGTHAHYHVAFVAEYDSQLDRPWLIGGNQGADVPGCVTLVCFSPQKARFRYFNVAVKVTANTVTPTSAPTKAGRRAGKPAVRDVGQEPTAMPTGTPTSGPTAAPTAMPDGTPAAGEMKPPGDGS